MIFKIENCICPCLPELGIQFQKLAILQAKAATIIKNDAIKHLELLGEANVKLIGEESRRTKIAAFLSESKNLDLERRRLPLRLFLCDMINFVTFPFPPFSPHKYPKILD